MAKKPELGDVIEAYCEHCRLALDVSVAAVTDGEVKQVQCRTCSNFVPYRPPSDATKRRQRVIRRVLANRDRKQSRSARPVEATTPDPPVPQKIPTDPRWLELTEGVDSTGAVPYTHYRCFSEGDYILHKSFGMGYVESVGEDDQIVVVFREGQQTLLINQPYDE